MPHTLKSRPNPESLAAYKKAKRLMDSIYQALKTGNDDLKHAYGLLCESIMFFTQSYESDHTWLAAINGRAEAFALMSRLMPSEAEDALRSALADYNQVIAALHDFEQQPPESLYQDTKQWILDAYQGRVSLVKHSYYPQAIVDLNECMQISPRIRFSLQKAEIQFMNGHTRAALDSWLEALRLFMRVESPFNKECPAFYERFQAIPETHSPTEAIALQLALLQEFWAGTNCWNR